MALTRKRSIREPGFDRGAWLVLAAVSGFVIAVLATTLYILSMPGDGWQMPYAAGPEPSPLNNFMGDWPTPLQANDIVLAVDDVLVNNEDQLNPLTPPPTWGDGSTVVYTILRNEETMQVNVTLHKLDVTGILRGFWHAMQDAPAEWSWSLIALIVFFLRPRDRAARLLLLIGVCHNAVTKLGWASATISQNFAPPIVFYIKLVTDVFWGYLFWPSIIMLALSFPARIYPLTRWPRLIPALLYALPLALILLTLATDQSILVTITLVGEAVALFLAFGAAFFNALIRSRDAVARAQTLWVIFGFVVSMGLVLPVYLLGYIGVLDSTSLDRTYHLVSPLLTLVLPVSLGIAITRYNLFAIDIIIRKTLVYALLTAVLALVYFGSVVLLQMGFQTLTADESPLAVVASTLIIAALFIPVRRRIQSVIDSRFYRRKYDAARTVEAFSAHLRDVVDLNTLCEQLVSVVDETIQPEQLSLWLRPINISVKEVYKES